MCDVIRPDFRARRRSVPSCEASASGCVFGRAAGFEVILDFGATPADDAINLLLKRPESDLVHTIAAHPRTTQGMLNANATASAVLKVLIFTASLRGR